MQMNSHKTHSMTTGGHHLGQVKAALESFTKVGMSFADIEAEAQRLIRAAGAVPSFSTVPGYQWATCIMKNDELCHGIPAAEKTVNDGDVITIDVGLIWEGYHLDTTTTFIVGRVTPEFQDFLNVGKKSLVKAIERARVGNSVYDISFAMQKVVERAGFNVVYQLTGHGVGEELHMDPAIPCFAEKSDKKVLLTEGQTIAVEIMYAAGDAYVEVDKDGWTYRTADGSLTGMFEETVLVAKDGPVILTK